MDDGNKFYTTNEPNDYICIIYQEGDRTLSYPKYLEEYAVNIFNE
jgi:hypothetical protein